MRVRVALGVERWPVRAPSKGALVLRVAARVRARVEGLQVDEGRLLLAEREHQLLHEHGHEEAQQQQGLGQRVVSAQVREAQDVLQLLPHGGQQRIEAGGQKDPAPKGVAEGKDLFGVMSFLKVRLDDLHGQQGAQQHEEEHTHHAEDLNHQQLHHGGSRLEGTGHRGATPRMDTQVGATMHYRG